MIHLTPTDLMKHILSNPKDAKAIARVLLEAPSTAKTDMQAPLVQTLLRALSKGESTQSSVKQTLESTPWVKNAPALIQEFKNLVHSLKQDPTLKPLAQPLEKYITNPQPHNPASPELLQTRLQNSGLHYEATLKQSIPTNTIPLQGRSLIDALLQLLPKAPLAPSLKNTLQISSKELLQSPSPQKIEQFLQTFSTALQHAQTHLSKSHPLFLLAKNIEQLQQAINAPILKNTPLSISSQHKIENPASPNQPNQPTPLQHQAKNLLTKFDALLPLIRSTNTTPQTIQEIRTTLLAIIKSPPPPQQKAQYITQNIPLHVTPQTKQNNLTISPKPTPTHPIQQPIQPSINSASDAKQAKIIIHSNNIPPASSLKSITDAKDAKPTQIQQTMPTYAIISQLQPQPLTQVSNDLQTRLAQAISKLQTIIQQSDAVALKLPPVLSRLENLQSQIKHQLSPLLTSPIKPQDSTINDIKRVLLEVQQNTHNKESPIAKESNTLATRALSQLEFHQLYSYVSQQTHTYLPYLWEGLQGGALQYKRDSEKTYCKIDLEFEQFNRVQILIALFENHYITLTIGVEHPQLFHRIAEHIKTLRNMLHSVGLIPQSVTLFPTLQEMPYESFAKEEAFGFDFKV